jgi:hypothetical protein
MTSWRGDLTGQQPENAETQDAFRSSPDDFFGRLEAVFSVRVQIFPEPAAETPLPRCQIPPTAQFRRAQDTNSMLKGQPEIMNQIHAFAAGCSNVT